MDYVFRVPDSESDAEVGIRNEEVVKFTEAGSGKYGLQDIENDLDWILPPNPVELNEVKYNENAHLEYSAFTHYEGRELQPIRNVQKRGDISVQIAKVDRISNDGNPVIEVDNSPYILDQGQPGEEYLVENTGTPRWKVVSKVIQ